MVVAVDGGQAAIPQAIVGTAGIPIAPPIAMEMAASVLPDLEGARVRKLDHMEENPAIV